MNVDTLRRFALAGVQARLGQLLDEIEELRTAFPRLAPLRSAHAAMSAAIDEAVPGKFRVHRPRRTAPEYVTAAAASAPAASTTNGEHRRPDGKPYVRGPYSKRKTEPKAKGPITAARKRQGEQIKKTNALKSWLTGRDVLSVLAQAGEPVVVDKIAERLKVPYATVWYRLKVRVEHGHVRLADPSTRAFEITPSGRKALELDRDTVAA